MEFANKMHARSATRIEEGVEQNWNVSQHSSGSAGPRADRYQDQGGGHVLSPKRDKDQIWSPMA